MANIWRVDRTNNKIEMGTTGTTINIDSHTASKILALDGSKNLEVVTIGSSLDYTRPTLNTIQDIRTTASPEFAGGTFTDVVTGVTPTAGDHLVTKEYADLLLGAFKTFFLSDTGSIVGALNLAYPHETSGGQSTIANDGLNEEYGTGTHLHQGFITEAGEPATTTIHAGVIVIHFHAKKGNSNQKITTLQAIISSVDADGSTGKTTIATSEVTAELTDTETNYTIHAVMGSDVEVASTSRLICDIYANVTTGAQDSVVTLYMEGTEDSYFTTKVDSGIWQNYGAVLDDLNTLGAVGADGEFLVGTGAGAFAWESGATARTSLGLGTGDSPQFTGIELGHASDTTITRVSAGVIAVEGTNVMLVGGAPTAHSIASHNDTTGTGAELNTLTDGSETALHSHAAGTDVKVGIDVGATADYIGAASNDGVLRTTTGLSYTDGGNFVTLGLSFLGLEALSDPGADRILFWDDSETAFKWLTVIQGVQIQGTILQFDINSLTEDTTPATNDYLVTYDVSHGVANYEQKKVLISNFPNMYADGDNPTANDSEANAMLKDHAYLTQTSGFVNAIITNTVNAVQGYVHTTNDPAGAGTNIQHQRSNSAASDSSIHFFVANGKYFEIVAAGDTPTIYWTPLVTGGAAPIDQD